MNRNALFADINKLRDNKNVVDSKKVKKANKSKKPPPPAKTDKISKKMKKKTKSTSINTRPATISIHKSSGGSSISRTTNLTPSNISQMPSFRLPGMGPPKTSTPPADTQVQADTTDSPAPQYKRRKSKKKKKKKKREATPTTIDIADDGLHSLDYAQLAEQEKKGRTRSRNKTQISVLADRAYPDASSLFDFQNKPPLLLFTYIFAFLASIDMMVNIPTLYSACNEAEGDNSYYYVFILMVYVVLQFVSTLLIGAWLDRRPIIEILAFLNICIILGNIIYTFGVHNKKGMTMLLGRAICGVGSCILVIGYAHVTRYSKLASRESRILYFRFVIAVGTIIGPLIGTIVGGGSANWKFLNIDENNSGSFVVACIGILYLISLITFTIIQNRKEQQIEQDRALWGRSESESEVIDAAYSDLHEDLQKYVWRPHRFCSGEAFMLWFLYTTSVFTFWSFCGAIIPVGAAHGTVGNDELSTSSVYAVFVYVGITYMAAFGLNKIIFSCFKTIQLEKRVIVSLILQIFGSIFLTSFGLNDDDGKNIYTWQIVVATPFLTSGFCISTITIPVLYVTLVGAGVAGLGLRMSWFFSLASFGLLAGPVYGYLVWKQFGSVNFISHTSSLILLTALLVAFCMMNYKTAKRLTFSQEEFDAMDTNGLRKSKDSGVKDHGGNNLKQGLLTDRL